MAIRRRWSKREKRWVYDVIVYQRGTQHWKRGFRTGTEARDYEAERRLRPIPTVSKSTVGQFLRGWYEQVIEGRLAVGTQKSYLAAVRSADRFLGTIPLRHLTSTACHAWVTQMPSYHQGHKQRHAGNSAIHHHGTVLKQALKWGVRMKILSESPMDGVKLPAPDRPVRPVMDEEQIRLFLAASRPSPYYAAYCLALGGGLGMSEVRSLLWEDVDLTFGRVTVRQGKTRFRRRTITIPEFARVALWGMAERSNAGEATNSSGGSEDGSLSEGRALVLRTPRGFESHSPTIFSASEHLIRKDLRQYTPVPFHCLRHSHATVLVMAGVPLKIVSERLGHASIKITADVYAHVTMTGERMAADAMDGLVRSR